MLLAEATVSAAPSAQAIKDWLEVVAYLSGIIAAVCVAWHYLTGGARKTEIDGQPLEVRAAADLVQKADHEKHIAEIKDELRRHAARRSEIYDEQKAQSERIARVEEKTDGQTRQLFQLDAKIEALPEKIVRLFGKKTP